MAVYNFINESSKAARQVCRYVKEKASADHTSLKEANFHVLRGAQMAGMLIELEYLSHPVSEAKLRSSRYQERLIKGILAGIMEYDRTVRKDQHALARRQEESRSAQR
jgi:N-acetylmuramoyl-L-alanine amidase